MNRVFWISSIWILFAAPCGGATMLELGSSPELAFHAEGERFSIGLGLGADFGEYPYFAVEADTMEAVDQIGYWVFTPAAITRLYLGHGEHADTFLEARMERDIPWVTGDNPDEDLIERLEGWGAFLGVGLRTRLNDRVRVGAAVGAAATVRSFSLWHDVVNASTVFRFIFQYEL